mgnify:CR=1 FL=1
MGDAIGQVLALGVGVALSPVPIIAVVLMLGTPRARANGPAFVLGWVAGLAVAGTVILLVSSGAGASEDGDPANWVGVLKIVLGLLLLAPLLTDALERNRDEAVRAGTAVVLDSRISALDKLGVAQEVLAEVDDAERRGELPRVEAVFDDLPEDEEYRELASNLQDQLDRAVTDAFSSPFLLAAALALAALVPVALARGEPR